MNILLAEDEPVSRIVLQAMLTSLGHNVTAVLNGAEAWDAWLQTKPRVVLSDWHMPELDGLGLCQRIRERRGGAYTYFLLLSARTGKESFLSAMDAGVDDFLTKPADREELTARLRVAERILGLTEELNVLQGRLAGSSIRP